MRVKFIERCMNTSILDTYPDANLSDFDLIFEGEVVSHSESIFGEPTMNIFCDDGRYRIVNSNKCTPIFNDRTSKELGNGKATLLVNFGEDVKFKQGIIHKDMDLSTMILNVIIFLDNNK